MSAERIDLAAIPPTLIQFRGGCLTVLRSDLATVSPEEGCALLLGTRDRDLACHVQIVWPCRNVWREASARHRHFALDPREQIAAQLWSRRRDFQVLAVAHSHPNSGCQPSDCDRALADRELITVILDGMGRPSAWWLTPDTGFISVPLQVWDTDEPCGV